VGILLASLLFGALFQGGAEVTFEMPGVTRDMVVTLQGFIILFSGAMAYVLAPQLARLLQWTKSSSAR
jgi:simple sugar transport system permease protein